MAGRRGKSGSGENGPNHPSPEEFRSKEYQRSSNKKRTRDYRDGHEPERAHRGRGDYGHESPSRNASYHRSRRSTSKVKKKRRRGSSHAERAYMTDDSRSQEWPGRRSRSIERGRRRHHQRESSKRRRIRHRSSHKRSSRDRHRRSERRVEYESNNSMGFFSHGERSGNSHSRDDREESVTREGSVPEPAIGEGIRYSAAHDNSYEQEIYGTPGRYPYDQLVSSYPAAGRCGTLHYSYGTDVPDLDQVRNGNANTSQDVTLREIGAQPHTTTVACQTSTFLPFKIPNFKFCANSGSNQIRSGFVSLGDSDNSYETPDVPLKSSTVQEHGNASPVSTTSAMSISSGRSPRSLFWNNISDISPREGPICIKCQKPEFTPIDSIVSCTRCLGNYHISCHDPAISVAGGVINVDSRVWKCQRCTGLADPGNGPHRQSDSPTRFRPRKIPRLSADASDTSSGRSSSLSKGSTRMTFSPADLQEETSVRNKDDHSRNFKTQPPIGGFLDSHYARGSESLGPSVVAAASKCREENFAHYTSDGINPAFPTDVDGRGTPQRNSHDGPGGFDVGVERRFDVPELTYYSDGMSKTANVFSGSRKLAVVIDNRSRSGSVSTNGYQGEGWNRTSPAIKDPRGDITPIPHSKPRRTLNSPTPQAFSQPSADQHSFHECPNGSKLHWRRSKRTRSVSEVPDSEEEREQDSTGGPMTLEPLKGWRDGRNSRELNNGYRPLPSTSPVQQAQDRTAGRHERLQRRLNSNDPSDTHSNEGALPSRLNSSSHRGEEAIERSPAERTGAPSPHYSPPPPNAGANGSLSHHHDETDHPAPRPPVVRARSSSVDSVISCRRCGSDMTIFDNRRVDICSSCIRKEHCRGSGVTDTISREPSHNTAPSYHSPAPSCLRFRIERKDGLRSRHSSTLSATGLPDNRPNTTPISDSLSCNISGGCTPQEPPIEVFRTAKQRVIERYQMKFPEITNGSLPSQPIKETAIRGQKARKVLDLPKPKAASAVERLKTAVPLKKNGVNTTTLVQASARVDARKDINGSTLPDILSATEPPKHHTRMAVMKNIPQLKKPARKGPAIKYAGGSINRLLVTDDSTSESDHSAKLRALEKRLQDQRSFTKNQAEKAAKLQVKLRESEKEKAALQEKLKALSAIGNHGPSERPAPGNEGPGPGILTESIPAQGPLQQELPKKKVLKRLVRWEEARSDTSTPQEDTQTEPGAEDDKPDTGKRTFRYGSMRDFYSGSKFCGEDPWAYPTVAEQPEPDPSTFRKHGWRKSVYRSFDRSRLMKVHLHRLTSHNRPPLTMTVEESSLDDDDESASVSGTPIGNRTDKPENEHGSTGVPRVISFDEFMGLPENMVPSVKDGCLGFRSGIINPRTGRLERNVAHHRIRAPGDLKLT